MENNTSAFSSARSNSLYSTGDGAKSQREQALAQYMTGLWPKSHADVLRMLCGEIERLKLLYKNNKSTALTTEASFLNQIEALEPPQ